MSKIVKDIIGLYDSNIKSLYSINHIATLLKKPYPYINQKINSMIDENIFTRKVVGRSHLCSLNLDNETTILLLAANEIEKKKRFEKDHKIRFNELSDYARSKDIHSIILIPSERKIFITHEEDDALKDILKDLRFRTSFHDLEELKEELTTKDSRVFSEKIIIHGYERFFNLIQLLEKELTDVHSPFHYTRS